MKDQGVQPVARAFVARDGAVEIADDFVEVDRRVGVGSHAAQIHDVIGQRQQVGVCQQDAVPSGACHGIARYRDGLFAEPVGDNAILAAAGDVGIRDVEPNAGSGR